MGGVSSVMLWYPVGYLKVKHDFCFVKEGVDLEDVYWAEVDVKERKRKVALRYKVPQEVIEDGFVDDWARMRALSTILSNLVRKVFYREGRFFFNYEKPVLDYPVRLWDLDIPLRVYRGFHLSYYQKSRNEYYVMIILKHDIILEKRLNEILRVSGVERLIEGINLSTESSYWKSGIGPKGAGTLIRVIRKSGQEYSKILNEIRKYYEMKSERLRNERIIEYVVEVLERDPDQPIIETKKLYKGKETRIYYLSGVLYLTPSFDTLRDLLWEVYGGEEEYVRQTLNDLHHVLRPDPKEFRRIVKRIEERLNEVLDRNIVEVRWF